MIKTTNLEACYKKLGQALKARRKQLGLNQEFAAKRLGISRGSLANIEVGRQRIALHDLFHMAEKLEMPAEKLFRQVRP